MEIVKYDWTSDPSTDDRSNDFFDEYDDPMNDLEHLDEIDDQGYFSGNEQ